MFSPFKSTVDNSIDDGDGVVVDRLVSRSTDWIEIKGRM